MRFGSRGTCGYETSSGDFSGIAGLLPFLGLDEDGCVLRLFAGDAGTCEGPGELGGSQSMGCAFMMVETGGVVGDSPARATSVENFKLCERRPRGKRQRRRTPRPPWPARAPTWAHGTPSPKPLAVKARSSERRASMLGICMGWNGNSKSRAKRLPITTGVGNRLFPQTKMAQCAGQRWEQKGVGTSLLKEYSGPPSRCLCTHKEYYHQNERTWPLLPSWPSYVHLAFRMCQLLSVGHARGLPRLVC